MLKAGFKARAQPLLFMITNSGSDRTSVAFEYHEHGIAVSLGESIDDEFFAYICALDDGDDPFADESCWAKANPELGNVIRPDYLRSQIASAKMLPSYQNTVLRLNFCVWTDADRAWITREAWESCEVSEKNPTPNDGLGRRRSVKELRIEDFAGAKAWGGLDLSWSQDLTARALTFSDTVAGVPHLFSFLKFWTPADTLRVRAARDRVPYDVWVREGWMEATPGKIVPTAAIGLQLHKDQTDFDVQFTAFDRYRHKDLEDKLIHPLYGSFHFSQTFYTTI
jgi:phage terminase large subunit-like protein